MPKGNPNTNTALSMASNLNLRVLHGGDGGLPEARTLPPPTYETESDDKEMDEDTVNMSIT